jgi:hypothetical protein
VDISATAPKMMSASPAMNAWVTTEPDACALTASGLTACALIMADREAASAGALREPLSAFIVSVSSIRETACVRPMSCVLRTARPQRGRSET